MKWLPRSLFNGPYLCLCLSNKDLKKVNKHLKTSLAWPSANGSCYQLESNDKVTCVVCLNSVLGHSIEALVGILTHEATHVVDDTFSFIGEKEPSKEFRAYSMQNVTQTLFEELLRRVELDEKLCVKNLKGK